MLAIDDRIKLGGTKRATSRGRGAGADSGFKASRRSSRQWLGYSTDSARCDSRISLTADGETANSLRFH